MPNLSFVCDELVRYNATLDGMGERDFASLGQILFPDLLFFIDNAEPTLRPVGSHRHIHGERFALYLMTIRKVAPGKSNGTHGRPRKARCGVHEKMPPAQIALGALRRCATGLLSHHFLPGSATV